ncbi:MAG: hypothetical protein CMJ40_01610 [Phycisphaerae bacterium]|nr:hypothetical protein [Phycisphaerae bacterium]
MNSQNPLMSPLGLSLLAILMILIVLSAELPALVSSTGTAVFSSVPEKNTTADLLEQHKVVMKTDRDRFNGRSFFFMPPSPPRPKPKVEKPKAAPPPPPPPPKVDTTPPKPTYPKNYTGPNLEAIVGPTAFFRPSSGKLIIVNVGETEQDIEVLGTNPPRSIEVKYKGGGPYTVQLFEMTEPEFLNQEIDSSAAEKDIVADARDIGVTEPELATSTGWPAGTIAGDKVRVVYRQGPYEGAITGILRRANQTWLVLEKPGSDDPVEIFKADVLSVQNLAPRPPDPEPEPEPEVAEPPILNLNGTEAGNGNSTVVVVGMETTNSNMSTSPANSNSTETSSNKTDTKTDPADSTESQQPDTAPETTKDG